MQTITLLAAVGSGLMAGLFFSFSTAVMPGLRDLSADAARAAMRRVNVRIQNPLFLLVFLGTGVLSGIAVFNGRVIGGLLYIVGSLLLTMFVNVPMNNRLERTDDAYWPEYLSRWTLWNHVRTVASAGALVMLIV
ncbi:anthrone oxygenase family protein [Lentzea sp. NBRC 105346]|uniref:anthrone oxygenase family protein n=1 Tax=Lentzea sp. NBRC 105346 TaxID=3032205 RepID=UPI00255353D4|nr:anthrone oxygenase family protein [Lentzea sp. NBRC 105346]